MLKKLSLVYNLQIARKYPVSLVHFVKNRCNARCSFCFIDFDNPKTFKNELTVNEIDKITKNLGPNLTNVNLTGGEPFARKEILDIARCYFKNTNIDSITMPSNGSLPLRMVKFSKSISKEFPKKKVLISISIDDLPKQHAKIRKIPNLFETAMKSYQSLKNISGNIMVNVAITCSHENYKNVPKLYDTLKKDYKVNSITANIVRDEGVYKIPKNKKRKILKAYTYLTNKILEDYKNNNLKNYNSNTLEGRIVNKKNFMLYKIMKKQYLKPYFTSTCHAGSLFGIIGSEGTIYPCEILDKPLGNIRDFNYDFLSLWHNKKTLGVKNWIKKTDCHCTYDCAWSLNILGNIKYQPELIKSVFEKSW